MLNLRSFVFKSTAWISYKVQIALNLKLFVDAGIVTLTAFISPFKGDRESVRALFPKNKFVEIACSANLEICEKRDPKGLYKKARSGEIKNFTGIDSPYEVPKDPNLIVNTENESVEESVEKIFQEIQKQII